ncbi:hypothetical protein Mapa_006214 [Marchantia paleacea]|nr:hypothetical protein Mapa_006214 [Marchantia paleacea]
MDPRSKSRSSTGMAALVRRVLGAGPRFKKRSKMEADEYFSSKSKGSSSSGSSSSSSSTEGSEVDSEAEGDDVLAIKEKKRPRRQKSRSFRKQRSYQIWIGNRPKVAFSCLRIRIVHMVRLMKTMAFLRRVRNAYRRLMHAAGSSKAVLTLTDLYYAITDLIPRADDDKGPPPTNIIVLRPIMLHSADKRSLRTRADIQALRARIDLQAFGSGALIRTNALVS